MFQLKLSGIQQIITLNPVLPANQDIPQLQQRINKKL